MQNYGTALVIDDNAAILTALIGHVMGQTPERFILSNARVAGGGEDRAVDVSDVTSLIQHVLDDTLPTEE